jgi:hypothetical protein
MTRNRDQRIHPKEAYWNYIDGVELLSRIHEHNTMGIKIWKNEAQRGRNIPVRNSLTVSDDASHATDNFMVRTRLHVTKEDVGELDVHTLVAASECK